MWPSIVQSEATRKRKSRARDLIGWALEEEGDDGLRALISDPSATSASSEPTPSIISAAAKRKSRMQREMEELERWLEDEEAGSGVKYSRGEAEGKVVDTDKALTPAEHATEKADEDARIWVSSAPLSSADGWEDMMTPVIRSPIADPDPLADSASEHGFEDDFADFVSATSHPHLPHARGFGPSEDKLLEVNYDVGRLTPMHTGMSYRSLGSMSDFGGADSMFMGREDSGEYGALSDDDDDDPDLPTRAEILETSRRIFGAASPPIPDPSASTPTRESFSTNVSNAPLDAQPASSPSTSRSAAGADQSLDLDDGDGDESFAAFDLSRVFSALQGMKDEIAGMEDEDERRRAAARVALGLVYGLGVGGDRLEQAPPTPGAP